LVVTLVITNVPLFLAAIASVNHPIHLELGSETT